MKVTNRCHYELQMLDMEMQVGTKIIPLSCIKRTINYFPLGHMHRIYLLLLFAGGLRPSEPTELTWDNFIFDKNMLIFRPRKQHGKVLRRVILPTKVMQEIKYYRDNGFFPNKNIFQYMKKSFSRQFNHKYRHKLCKEWSQLDDIPRQGVVAQYYKYSLRCFRTTYATLVYYYYSQVYGSGDLSVKKTAKQMGHSSSFTTSEYYIQRISDLEVERYPLMPFLELIDHLLYSELQTRLIQFTKKNDDKENQNKLIEYDFI